MQRKRASRWVLLVIALALAAIFAFPLWFMVTSAFKAEEEIMAVPVHWLPHQFQGWEQFRNAADASPLWRYLANSTLVSVIQVAVTVFFGSLAGFGFARYRFPFHRFLFFFVISTMMISFQILVVPLSSRFTPSAGKTAMSA